MDVLTLDKIRQLEEQNEGVRPFPFVFKLVNKNYGTAGSCKYKSCRIAIHEGGVGYDVGRWTLPTVKGSRLLTFENIEAVNKFDNQYGTGEDTLFVAEAINPVPIKYLLRGGMEFSRWWKLWNQFMKDQNIDLDAFLCNGESKHPAPEGTVGVEAVRLVTQVYDWRD